MQVNYQASNWRPFILGLVAENRIFSVVLTVTALVANKIETNPPLLVSFSPISGYFISPLGIFLG
jgi:hypothetical protein